MTLEAVFVVVGVLATVISVAALAARLPAAKRPPAPRPRPASASVPSQLLQIERIVERSGESGVAAHTLLRPVLVGDRRGAPRSARRAAGPRPRRGPAVAGAARRGSSFVRTARRRLTPAPPASPRASSRRCSTAWRRCERLLGRRARGPLRPDPGRGRAGGRGQARRAGARPARAAGRRARADRGQPGPRQDADRAFVRRGHRAALRARAVHARPDAVGRDRVGDL